MRSVHRHVTPERAERLEPHLRARADQLRPRARADQLRPRGTPLGCCRVCATIVYAGDSLVMSAGYLLHGGCAPAGGAGAR